jgi:hypothetical protein
MIIMGSHNHLRAVVALFNPQVFAGAVGGPLSPWVGSGRRPGSLLGGVVLGRHRGGG